MTATAVVARLDRAIQVRRGPSIQSLTPSGILGARSSRATTAVLLQTAQHQRVLAPYQNIENNPMQSNEGAPAWMLYSSKIF
jgi:hypothetical protein